MVSRLQPSRVMPAAATRLLLTALLLCACGEPSLALPPGGSCAPPTVEQSVTWSYVGGIDLLFVIDNSASMSEEQAALAAAIPRLVDILATGDFDQDGDTYVDGEPGDLDFEPIASLHLGVVTTDMGTGGTPLPTCDRPEQGDDGLLRADASCGVTTPPFLSFDPSAPLVSPAELGASAACTVMAGTTGCGIEQPLEAMLKALSPAAPTAWTAPGYVAPTFFGGSFGHGDGENDGFVRRGSLLAIVVLTDEDDCSLRDPALFDADGPYAATDLNLRCAMHTEALHPVERYVDGLLQLRDRPGLLVFSAIEGVPPDLVPAPGERPDWDRLICEGPATCDSRMREEPDPAMPTRLRPSCTNLGGDAYPPTRMMQVARGLESRGAAVGLTSICAGGFEGAFDEIFRNVTSRLIADGIPRPIVREADGHIDCSLRAVLPDELECADFAGSVPFLEDGAPVREDGRAVCAMEQLLPSDRSPGAPLPTDLGPGWYYDDFSNLAMNGSGARVAFTVYPPPGTLLHFTCSVASGAGGVTAGTPCDPSEDTVCSNGSPPRGTAALVCDPILETCAVPCAIDDDCAAGGLDGFVCDERALGELDPRHVCVDPTCG